MSTVKSDILQYQSLLETYINTKAYNTKHLELIVYFMEIEGIRLYDFKT